ncbi:MAG: hypothetical protein ABI624_13975 [Casimicrobiaceae bacterium]
MARYVEFHAAFGRVVWARRPFHGRLGACTGVRLRNGQLAVAIRHAGHVEWVPAARALTEAEAVAWVRSGF